MKSVTMAISASVRDGITVDLQADDLVDAIASLTAWSATDITQEGNIIGGTDDDGNEWSVRLVYDAYEA
jgi:hypothetical protein